MRHSRITARARHVRRGALVVEMALSAPVLFLFFFASLEFARANMLRHAIHQAVYEGARAGIGPGATDQDVRDNVNRVLTAVGAIGATVTVDPMGNLEGAQQVTATVSIPLNNNGWVVPKFFRDRTLTATITLTRERDDDFVVY